MSVLVLHYLQFHNLIDMHGGVGDVYVLFYIAIFSELLKPSFKEEARRFLRLRKATKFTCLGQLNLAGFTRTLPQGYRSNKQLLEDTDQQSCHGETFRIYGGA